MKHHSYSYLLLLGLFLFFVQCTKPDEHAGNFPEGKEAADEYYTCPMHPSVRSDRPGACPVCNMALVKVSGNQSGREGFRLTAWQRQLANIEVMPVKATGGVTTGPAAVLTGEVVLNEKAVEAVTARVPGRIDRLFIRATGQQVKKGQALYEIYSEPLVAAQQEYLLALRQEGINLGDIRAQLSAAARQKLLLWGMTDAQIRHLKQNGKPNARLTYFSTASGTVTDIFLREGSYVQEGTALLRLIDLSSVWVEAQLYPMEHDLLRDNPKVRVVSEASPGDTLSATLVLNNPTMEQGRQLNIASFEVSNSAGSLRPGMLAYVLVGTQNLKNGGIKKGVMVPHSAVLPGEMPVVWVEMPDSTFQSRMVTLGAQTSEWIQVLDGLHPGERIVTKGTYLLNSEYVLKNGPTAVHQH